MINISTLVFLMANCMTTSSLRSCSNQDIQVSDEVYIGVFDASSQFVYVDIDGLRCIWTCVGAEEHVRMAVFDAEERKCACLDYHLVDNMSGTHRIKVVSLRKDGKNSIAPFE